MEFTKLTEDNEKKSKTGSNQQSSNGALDNFSLAMVSESFVNENIEDTKSKDLRITLHIYREYYLRLHKSLFLVKFALFFWFAGGVGMQIFFSVFLKQRGLSVTHISLITAASGVFQLLSASSSAVIADKIGRAKPVLFSHLAISVIVSIIFLLIPPLASDTTKPQFLLRSSNNDYIPRLIAEAWCNTSTTSVEQKTCKLYYSTNASYISYEDHCFSTTRIDNKALSQIAFDANSTKIFENIKICYHESSAIMRSGTSYTFCNFTYCEILEKECKSRIEKCSNRDSNINLLFWVYAVLITIHYMTHSCVFRCYDVTVISLTTQHNADFGRQSIFSILGGLLGPFLMGYATHATSGGDKNYSLVFFFYISFTILSSLASWNLNVRMRKPGQKMCLKVLELLKKPDILAFILVLLVLGASFNFMVLYSSWYLEDLGASKLLLGLVMPLSSVSALFSLYNSEWWLRILGEHNLFVMALVGYGFFGISYSFLVEPWYSILIGGVVFTFSYHLLWVAVVKYAHTVAPEGLYATVIVMSGVLHYLVSKIPATLIGGVVMDAYGARIAFRLMGCTDLVIAVLYACFRCFRRSYSQ